jgi:hypothetical protein
MLHAWIFGPVAITVGYWEQRGAEVELGSRLEIRRVAEEPVPGAAAGVAGFRVLPIGEGIFRVDMFRGPDGPVYHYHPAFEDGDVGERYFDEGLTASPVDWVIGKLGDVRSVLAGSGAADVADAIPQAELDLLLPSIREAVERSFDPLSAHVRS